MKEGKRKFNMPTIVYCVMERYFESGTMYHYGLHEVCATEESAKEQIKELVKRGYKHEEFEIWKKEVL